MRRSFQQFLIDREEASIPNRVDTIDTKHEAQRAINIIARFVFGSYLESDM